LRMRADEPHVNDAIRVVDPDDDSVLIARNIEHGPSILEDARGADVALQISRRQNAVSQLESRSDLLLSTLRRYVKALGADLDLVVRLKGGSQIVLEGLGEVENKSRAGAKPARRLAAMGGKRIPR